MEKCKKFGAKVVIHGAHIGEAKDFALSSPEYAGMRYINGYDDPEIVAGAGTCGRSYTDPGQLKKRIIRFVAC